MSRHFQQNIAPIQFTGSDEMLPNWRGIQMFDKYYNSLNFQQITALYCMYNVGSLYVYVLSWN